MCTCTSGPTEWIRGMVPWVGPIGLIAISGVGIEKYSILGDN
jgi:hypothetical protein